MLQRSISLFIFSVLLVLQGWAQTVIDHKGTKTVIDTSKWTLDGQNLYNKNTGNVGIGTATPAEKLHVESGLISNFLGIANFFAPVNNIAGNASMIRLGISNTTRNAAELRYLHNANGSNLNRFDLSFDGLNEAPLSVRADRRVGVGTTSPTATLHSNGSVRLEGLAQNNANTQLLAVDTNGNVARKALADVLPRILAGADGTDALTTATTATYPGTNRPQIATRTFTTTQRSLVEINYSIGIDRVGNKDGGSITDTNTKLMGIYAEIYSGSPLALVGGSNLMSIPFTSGSSGSYISGPYYLARNIKRLLPAGAYEVRFFGFVFAASGDDGGISASYGPGGLDRIDIIATPQL